MPLMTWTEDMSVGVRVLDDDHKRLVAMLNDLYDAIQNGRGKETMGRILNDLVQYTKVHFAREEKFFGETGYPGLAAHKKEHDALTGQVIDVQRKFTVGANAALSIDVLRFLRDWLTNHIQGTDRKYQPHLNAKGIR